MAGCTSFLLPRFNASCQKNHQELHHTTMSESTAQPNLEEIHDFLIDLAAEAGKVITSSLPTIDSTDSKKNSKLVETGSLFLS